MNRDLGFSSTTYGLAAGMFSIGYALGQVPSNIMLMRLGAPIWLAVLCFAWGLTAGAFAFVSSAATFVGLRLLLGFCEVGHLGITAGIRRPSHGLEGMLLHMVVHSQMQGLVVSGL